MKLKDSAQFRFNGSILYYFDHFYNDTIKTERGIELPIVHYYLEKYKPKRCLEIGNVSNHYYPCFQDLMIQKIVVDKTEKDLNVINKNIKDYNSKIKFDFVFSISTFEHMDSDRNRNKDYIKKKSNENSNACNNMIHVINNLLNPKAIFVITTPINYTIEWNQTIFNPNIMNKEFLNVESINIYYFKRLKISKWYQTKLSSFEINKIKNYMIPLEDANKYRSLISIIEIIK